MAARPELELHGLVVLRGGNTVLEQYWAPYVADDRALVYSASKTFTASAIALAVAGALAILVGHGVSRLRPDGSHRGMRA